MYIECIGILNVCIFNVWKHNIRQIEMSVRGSVIEGQLRGSVWG